MTTEKTAQPALTDQEKMNRVWILATLVLITALLVAAAYAYEFRAYPSGDPAAWGQFGDYFGGIVNPVVGMVTVMLVIITLGVTRAEAAEQRTRWNEQLKRLEEQQILSEHQKRLEGVFASWQTLNENTPVFSRGDRSGLPALLHGRKLRESLSDPRIIEAATNRRPSDDPPETLEIFADLFPLFSVLGEFAEYIKTYDAISGGTVLTNYYRRRLYPAAFIFCQFKLLDADTLAALTPR